MSKRSFSDITQRQWLKACTKLGLIVNERFGKGSHALVRHPHDGRKYTLQYHLHKFINIKIFKKLVEWGFGEEEIWDALR